MDKLLYQNHLQILKDELLVAFGCTEPIAIAYAAAKARELLGEMPTHCTVRCSGSIIKNVKAVTVPNSGGMRGIEVAATLGIVGGDPERELAVLEGVCEQEIQIARKLIINGFCDCSLVQDEDNLYIAVEVQGGGHTAEIQIREHHKNITRMVKDGEVLLDKDAQPFEMHAEKKHHKMLLNVRNILEFADAVNLDDIVPLLTLQMEYNTAISQEGLRNSYGVEVGQMLMGWAESNVSDKARLRLKARAAAAAGSDARMNGCPMPVIINSGSGNQGITATMPVIVYGQELGTSKALLYRSLVVSNLISIHQKKYIGSLSAYCGATSAATGSACGIAYMMLNNSVDGEKRYQIICDTITNSIQTLGGMVCDGAKASCAAKIALAVENALMGLEMSLAGNVFKPGEGLTMDNPEDTIAAVGRMARVGMKRTDIEILNIMLGK